MLLLVATVAGVVAVNKSSDAQKKTRQAQQQTVLANARGLSSKADSLQVTQPDVAMLLAVEAQKLGDSPETRAGLISVLSSQPHLEQIDHGLGLDGSWPAAISPNGRLAAVAHEDGSVRVWDVASQKPVTDNLSADKHRVIATVFSRQHLLAVGWADGTAKLFDTRQRHPAGIALVIPPVLHGVIVGGFSPDGSMLAAVDTSSGMLLRWDTTTGEELGKPIQLAVTSALAFAFSPKGSQIAISGSRGSTQVVETVNANSGDDDGPLINTPGAAAQGLAYSPDGRTLARGGPGTVTLIDLRSRQVGAGGFLGQQGAIITLAYSPDGAFLASTSEENTVAIWRTTDGSLVGRPFSGHSNSLVQSAAFTADSRQFITSNYGELIVWDVQDRNSLPGTGESRTNVTGLKVDATRHRLLIAGDDKRIRVWDTQSLRPLGMSAQLPYDIYDEDVDPTHGVIAVALVGGTLDLPTAGGGIDLLSDTPSPAVKGHLRVDGTPSSIAFSPSGNRLAVTTLEGELGRLQHDVEEAGFRSGDPGGDEARYRLDRR